MAAQIEPRVSELAESFRLDPLRTARRIVDHEQRLQHELALALLKIEKLEEEKRLARAERFGASSEANPQYPLFDEAECFAEAEPDVAPGDTIVVPAHERQRPRRKPLPADLPRRVIEHPPVDTHCSCGAERVRIGTKVSEQLDIVPRQLFVIEHRRGTFKCPCCVDAVPVTAPMPAQPVPKSIASPGLLAHVATAKYADGMPLYRQSESMAREGIDYPRQTMASGMVRCGDLVLPLVEHMTRCALQYDVLQMDETSVQVLKEPGRSATSKSYMWVMRGGPPHAPVIRFHYEPSRGGEVPKALLADYAGFLHTDGYAGYHEVLKETRITGLGCWAHTRRKFIEAQKALPKGQRSERLERILKWIGELYRLEREWAPLLPVQRRTLRAEQSKPIIEKIGTWLGQQSAPPDTLLGKALKYMRGEWPRLQVYLGDGRLRMDTNLVENAIRPFALGRRSWLFSDSVAGARSSAALYSLVETAKANALNPYAYLKLVFTRLPRDPTDLDALLPWRVDRAELERMLLPPHG